MMTGRQVRRSTPGDQSLFTREGFRNDRVVGAPVERPVTAVIQLRNRDTVAAISVRSRVVPGHQRAARQGFPGNLLQYTRTVTVINASNMQAGIVAALQVSFYRRDGLVGPHSVKVDLYLDRLQAPNPC